MGEGAGEPSRKKDSAAETEAETELERDGTKKAAPPACERLTCALVSSWAAPGLAVGLVKSVSCAGWGFAAMDDLAPFRDLARLDVSRNRLRLLDGVEGNRELTWLAAARNELVALDPLFALDKLRVLNVSHNRLASLVPVHRLTSLQALVANNNVLESSKVLRGLTQLNSLILSHNLLDEVRELPRLVELRKVNLAHNRISSFPTIGALYKLQELRLGGNRIAAVPDVLAELRLLKVVDLGHNLIHEWRSVAALARAPALKSLTLAGNPLAAADDYAARVRDAAPQLKILDSRQISDDKGLLKDRAEHWKRKQDPKYAQAPKRNSARSSKRGETAGVTSDDDVAAVKSENAFKEVVEEEEEEVVVEEEEEEGKDGKEEEEEEEKKKKKKKKKKKSSSPPPALPANPFDAALTQQRRPHKRDAVRKVGSDDAEDEDDFRDLRGRKRARAAVNSSLQQSPLAKTTLEIEADGAEDGNEGSGGGPLRTQMSGVRKIVRGTAAGASHKRAVGGDFDWSRLDKSEEKWD